MSENLRATPAKKRISINFLPDGSQLHDVMFPRYDEAHRLTGALKAAAMTLVGPDDIAGEQVRIEFYNLDESLRGAIDLPAAAIDQQAGILRAGPEVRMVSDDIIVVGRALIYDYSTGEAFLYGPGHVEMKPKPATSMNFRRPVSLGANAAAGIMLASTAFAAEPAVKSTSENPAPSLAEDLGKSIEASEKTKRFLERAREDKPAGPAPAANSAEAKPLKVADDAGSSRVRFDGGVYSDMDSGTIKFLKNVRVNDPRFELTGANELTVFFTPKDRKKTAVDPKKPGGMPAFGGLSGDIDKIVATGKVRIRQSNVESGKPPVEASGAVFTYHPKSGVITLSGGYPWVLQGGNYLRARQPNLILRIEKNGDFHTNGQWDLGGKIEQK